MINICKTLDVQCGACPFEHRCNIGFNTYETKDYWLLELQDMLENIEYAIEKVKETEDE